MLSLQQTLSLGYLKQRRMRTLLVLLSIALGVATLVATRSLNRHLNQAAQSAVHPLSGFAKLMITNYQSGVPRAVADRIDPTKQETADSALADVRAVDPMVLGRVALPALDNRSVLLLGLEPPADLDVSSLSEQAHKDLGLEIKRLAAITDLQAGAAQLLGVTPVMVSARLAEDLGLTPEDSESITLERATILVRLAGIEMRALVVGTIHSSSEKSRLDPNMVVMPIAQAAAFIYPNRPEYISHINIRLKDRADVSSTARDLQQRIGPLYQVLTVDETYEKVRDVTAGLELGFTIGGTLALVVGLFLVYNALSVSVAERRHEIGILRSVGATRSPVAGLFVFEASVLGLVGSLLGLPIGYGLATIALGPISRIISETFIPMGAPQLGIDPWTLALALGAGLATTVAAALMPALEAAREEPADVVRRAPGGRRLLARIAQIGASGLLVLIGMAFVFWREQLPVRMGTFTGIVCIMLAGLVATPLLAVLAGKLLQPFFRLCLGLEGRLAADNMARSPGRTGIVIAALAATGALMVQTAGFIRSSEEAILVWLDESIAADVFVAAGAPITKPGEGIAMDESLVKELRSLPRVDAALAIRFHPLAYRDRVVMLLALDTQAFENAESAHSLGRNLTRYPRLREPDTALVSENFAALYKVKVGDHIEVMGLDGPLPLEVVGTVVDYTWNRGTIMVDRDWYREKFRDRQVDIFDVYLRPEDGKPTTEPERRALIAELTQRLGRQEAVHGTTRGMMREEIVTQLRRVYGLAYARQTVVGMVALLGVISALFISVLQRRRELGLLRAVGASRGQVLRSVLAEAVLMGLVGGVLGLAIGVVLEWYVIDIVLLDEAGFIFAMQLPWLEAGVVFGLSVLLATLVGLGPAYQATQIGIAEAIAYE